MNRTDYQSDVAIYAATAAGVTAAVAAADGGCRVRIIEPGLHVGGMVSGGLSATDWGSPKVIGGWARGFYLAVAEHYRVALGGVRGPEPHVAEQIFRDWLDQRGIQVTFGQRVEQVVIDGQKIHRLIAANGDRFEANVFIDASYEGDLLARAGIEYCVGRESRKRYGESLAGRQPLRPVRNTFHVPVSAYDDAEQGRLSPLIHDQPMVAEGEGDGGVMAYTHRLCATDRPDNRRSWTRPPRYRREQYLLLVRLLEALPQPPDDIGFFTGFRHNQIPSGKCDANSNGPLGLNILDGSVWSYADASYAQRQKLLAHFTDYQQGLLWFLASDPSVPAHLRDQMNMWGLCRDEFTDRAGWPHQLYIRDARRMVGEYTLTQHDLNSRRCHYDAIGMGSYNIDIREVQRVAQPVPRFPNIRMETFNEGYWSSPVEPYQIPYRCLVPKYDQCHNLLVPVCVSASHVAFASLRMEPQYMMLGHAAGAAAALSHHADRAVQRIDIEKLQQTLIQQGAILAL